eukprot:7925406-Pyramimonas_sp.AAC.1
MREGQLAAGLPSLAVPWRQVFVWRHGGASALSRVAGFRAPRAPPATHLLDGVAERRPACMHAPTLPRLWLGRFLFSRLALTVRAIRPLFAP